MAGLHIIRYIATGPYASEELEEETVWFKYITDAESTLNTMIDLHIALEHTVPVPNNKGQTEFHYSDGSYVFARVLTNYDDRSW